MEIYHGSNVIVREPRIITSGFYKDFGFGFYCTNIKAQAIKWALIKNPNHIVSTYTFEYTEGLNILKFDKVTEEWLDFIAYCRYGRSHIYDIVEGPMADDTVWDYVEDFLDGNISRAAFWELVKFKYPTHQITFCSDKALNHVKYLRSEKL